MYYIYILKSKVDDSTYTGYTNDLKRRLEEHNNKEGKSTKFKAPFELIYYEAYKSQKDANYREKNLKRYAQAHKALRQRIKNSLE